MGNDFSGGYALYFAYGSNILSGRLKKRGVDTLKLGNATLAGHSLCFHKRSKKDGSGKADAARTENPDSLIHGVVFKIREIQLPILDKFEGATGTNPGYSRKEVAVRMSDGSEFVAWTYLANSHAIDSALKPYTWYHDLVRYGAEEHGFPEDYRKSIDSIQAVTDPDPNRDDKIKAEELVAEYLESRGRG
jgi:gamma-glutamylcyclotransferase